MSLAKALGPRLLVPSIVLVACLMAATSVHAVGAATVVLSRASGAPGTPVTATYTAPGCGGVAAKVAFSLDSVGGHQFGSTSLNLATCSAVLTFPISGSAGPHQVFGYVPNSGAPVASAPFTILAAPPGPPTPAPTATPEPTPTPTPTPTATPTPTPTATPQQSSNGVLNSLLVPGLIALIVLLVIALVVLLVLLRRNRSRETPGDQPPAGSPPPTP